MRALWAVPAGALVVLTACSSTSTRSDSESGITPLPVCAAPVQALCETPSPSAPGPSVEPSASPSPAVSASPSPAASATVATVAPSPTSAPASPVRASVAASSASSDDSAIAAVVASDATDATVASTDLEPVRTSAGRQPYDQVSVSYTVTNSGSDTATLQLSVMCTRDGDASRTGSGSTTVAGVAAGAKQTMTVGPMRVSFAPGRAGAAVRCSAHVDAG